MKKIFLIIAVVLYINSYAQIKQASLQASGLTCSMCSKAIYKALTAIPFVEKVNSDIETSTFNITFKNNSNADIDVLQKAVEDAGFSVSLFKLTVSFDNVVIKNDAHIQLNDKTFHFVHVGNETLNGEKIITVIDKKFIPAKDFKKYNSYTTMKCYATGTMQSCCSKNTGTGKRIYHVTI
jgi:copper chaperone CopZ